MRGLARIATLLLLGLGACGTTGEDRFDLRTPGSEGRADAVPRIRSTPPEPAVRRGKPTRAEVAVIRGWSDALRAGHVAEAARFFALPAEVLDGTNPRRALLDRSAALEFNRGLPCGARLIATKRGEDSLVIATFRLTERPGRGKCNGGVGQPAVTAFLIRDRRIARWLRVPVPARRSGPDTTTS
jgi:hypothetical protein